MCGEPLRIKGETVRGFTRRVQDQISATTIATLSAAVCDPPAATMKARANNLDSTPVVIWLESAIPCMGNPTAESVTSAIPIPMLYETGTKPPSDHIAPSPMTLSKRRYRRSAACAIRAGP